MGKNNRFFRIIESMNLFLASKELAEAKTKFFFAMLCYYLGLCFPSDVGKIVDSFNVDSNCLPEFKEKFWEKIKLLAETDQNEDYFPARRYVQDFEIVKNFQNDLKDSEFGDAFEISIWTQKDTPDNCTAKLKGLSKTVYQMEILEELGFNTYKSVSFSKTIQKAVVELSPGKFAVSEPFITVIPVTSNEEFFDSFICNVSSDGGYQFFGDFVFFTLTNHAKEVLQLPKDVNRVAFCVAGANQVVEGTNKPTSYTIFDSMHEDEELQLLFEEQIMEVVNKN